jgi:hypothetical protein
MHIYYTEHVSHYLFSVLRSSAGLLLTITHHDHKLPWPIVRWIRVSETVLDARIYMMTQI